MPISIVKLTFNEDGTFTIELRFDVDACVGSYEKDNPEMLKLFIQYSRARLDGDAHKEIKQIAELVCANISLNFEGIVVKPTVSQLDLGSADDPKRQQIAIFNGITPKAQTRCRWVGQDFLKIVHLEINSPQHAEPYVEMIQNFEDSAVYAGVPTSRTAIGIAYIYQGILHIIPAGLDHLLFILGLFFAMNSMRQAFWLISTFTLAHSITLMLVASGMTPPVWLQVCVEPLIALSIAVIAIENCCFKDMQKWRPLIVFLFGLIHGMGFAGVLSELGIPDHYFWVALLSFNIGVEIAQIAVVAGAALLFLYIRKSDWYRSRIVIPASLMIGACGLVWFVMNLIGE